MYTREELVEKLNITNVNKLEQDRILANVAKVVSQRILIEIADKLNDQDLDHLEKLIDDNKESDFEWYIKGKFDHYEDFAMQIEQKVIDEMSEMNQSLDKAINEVRAEATEEPATS